METKFDKSAAVTELEARNPATKQTYVPPQLIVHGTISELTQGGGGALSDCDETAGTTPISAC